MPLSPINSKPESLTELVYDAIRQAIINFDLEPGQSISEASLAKELGVSKTPVREALLELEYIGLIEPDGRRGGRVAAPSEESLRSAYEIREGLERQAARLAARRASEPDLEAIRALADESVGRAESLDVEGFRALDRQFHFAVAAATANTALSRLVRDAYDLTWTLRRRDTPITDDSIACAHHHRAIADAMAARDEDGAGEAMYVHISKIAQMVMDAFQRSDTAV